ncbi:transposase [Colwellia sp. E2M01]|uniref:REP-associated tyrosine transposase n=1 Tax=Colwellia sp. E2M01 TaxID=2841561 RepID=UPI001C0A020A|nr:transposase [Colwellia sp. E2M01]MBU2870198.1 transposase [Colwellia sp. E2M01]
MHKSHLLRKGRSSQAWHYYVVTITTKNRFNYFSNLQNAQITVKQLYLLESEGAIKTISYVLMPDHLHWQFQLLNKYTLSEVIKRFKGRSTQLINNISNHTGSIWQSDYFDHQIKDDTDLINQARYIIANPLRAGIVKSLKKYPYWNSIYLK